MQQGYRHVKDFVPSQSKPSQIMQHGESMIQLIFYATDDKADAIVSEVKLLAEIKAKRSP